MVDTAKQSSEKNGVVLEKQRNLKTLSYSNKRRNFGDIFQSSGVYERQEHFIYNVEGEQQEQDNSVEI